MNNLLDFLSRHYHWFLFVFLEVICAVLLFQYNNYQSSVWFSSANVVTGKVYEVNSKITQFFSLVKLNEELTHRNVYLEQQVQALYNQLEEKDRYHPRQGRKHEGAGTLQGHSRKGCIQQRG